MRRSGSQQIAPLSARDARHLKLVPNSRFSRQALERHLAEFPDLSYRIGTAGQYGIGGLWRRRLEIGLIVELSEGPWGDDLLGVLLDAYRARACSLVVVDPTEHERHATLYDRQGFVPLETVIQLELRGLDGVPPNSTAPIREMTERDIAAVLEVERHSFPFFWWNSQEELLWYASLDWVEIHVAVAREHPERVVGYAGFTIFEGQGHLDRLAVDEKFQGQGYGSALLAFALRRMKLQGARRAALTTQLDNSRSQALYNRFGFCQSGWQQEISGLWLKEQPEVA